MMRRAFGLVVLCALGLAGAADAAVERCAAPPGAEAQIGAVAAMVNAERRARGLPPLEVSARLNRAAQAHACQMARTGKFGHRGIDGTTPKTRVAAAGCRSRLTAENIAMGTAGARQTMGLWMKSAGHRRNILLGGVDSIGIGLAAGGPGGPRWVQVFAAGC